MALFPLFINLKDQECLVVGGGKVAERKVAALLRFHASITVISPTLTESLKLLCLQGKIRLIQGEYQEEHIKNVFLVIAATSIREVNEKVYRDAQKSRIFVNVVDQPEFCNFIFPSIVIRDPLVVGITTSGDFPAMSKRLRKKLDRMLPESLGDGLSILRDLRVRIRGEIPEERTRKHIIEKLLEDFEAADGNLSTDEMKVLLEQRYKEYKNNENT